MEKDIEFIIDSLASFLGKKFRETTFTYYGTEPIKRERELGYLLSVYDIDEHLILAFGKDNSKFPTIPPEFKTDDDRITFLKNNDEVVLKFKHISYMYDFVLCIDRLENGIAVYKTNSSMNPKTKVVRRRHFIKEEIICDKEK